MTLTGKKMRKTPKERNGKMGKYREILLFVDTEKSEHRQPLALEGLWFSGEKIDAVVKVITEQMMACDPKALRGCRPHLIVNFYEPDSETAFQQSIVAIEHNAQIINLYE